MIPLIEQALPCPKCDNDELRYVGYGEWDCECGFRDYADWLDGRGVAEWLDLQLDLDGVHARHPNIARRINSWASGQYPAANFYALDRLLVRLDLHSCDIPDYLWCESPRRGTRGRVFSPDTKAAAVARVLAGEAKAEVALAVGSSPKTIDNWLRKAAA